MRCVAERKRETRERARAYVFSLVASPASPLCPLAQSREDGETSSILGALSEPSRKSTGHTSTRWHSVLLSPSLSSPARRRRGLGDSYVYTPSSRGGRRGRGRGVEDAYLRARLRVTANSRDRMMILPVRSLTRGRPISRCTYELLPCLPSPADL